MTGASLARAAAAGDSRAVALATVRGQPREGAEQQLLAAAQRGDPDAMFALGLLGLRQASRALWRLELDQAASRDAWEENLRSQLGEVGPDDLAAIAGSVDWLRAAAQHGVAPAMAELAGVPTLSAGERLHWLRSAAAAGAWRAASRYADTLTESGHRDEAARWYEADVDADSAYAAARLATWYENAGRDEEAARFRRLAAELERPPFRGAAAMDIAPIVITAVVTTGVVPFLQTLVTKAAEEAYPQIRALIGRLFQRHSEPGPHDATPHRLLLVSDDLRPLEVFLWADVSDDALKALGELTMADLARLRSKDEPVTVAWDSAQGKWVVKTQTVA